jgi:hypothetical protein
MIIKQGFVDHWKVRKLKRLSGRAEVVEWLIRLWVNCETRKSWRFKATDQVVIADICTYEGGAEEFVSWLLETRIFELDGEELIVHGWEEHNKQVVANWNNGAKGGRPRISHGVNGITAQPELPELTSYCLSINMNGSEAETISDYWKANGFKTGKNRIRDWKAFVRNWKRRRPEFNRNSEHTKKDRPCV